MTWPGWLEHLLHRNVYHPLSHFLLPIRLIWVWPMRESAHLSSSFTTHVIQGRPPKPDWIHKSVVESCIVLHPLHPWGPHVTPLQVGPAHIGSPCDPDGVPVWPIARSALLHSHDPNFAPYGIMGAEVDLMKLISEQHNTIFLSEYTNDNVTL